MDIQNLIDMVDEIVLVFDASGTITMGNAKIDDWLPVSREEMIGKNVRFLKQENYTEGILTIEEVIQRRETVFNNVLYTNGRLISYTGKPTYDEQGNFTGGVLTGRDMSYLIRMYNGHVEHLERTADEELIGFFSLIHYLF